MARVKNTLKKKPETFRKGLTQTQYWSKFGVSQATASQYENGRPIPLPIAMLMELNKAGKISDSDLELAAIKVLKRG
jgi:transcriptional regulator with XRE-family HTH domain